MMKSLYFLFLAINLLTLVWSKDDFWFGNVFTSVMNSFSIDSKAVQPRNLQCSLDSYAYKKYIANGTYWAAQMDNACAKSVGGIFEGDTYHPGHPSQCINTHSAPLNISGKYCLPEAIIRPSYAIDPDFDSGDFARDYPPYDAMLNYWEGLRHKTDMVWHSRNVFRWGLCIPHSCTSEDLQVSLNLALKAACVPNNITIDIRLTESNCYTKYEVYDRPMSTGARVWFYVLYAFMALVFVGTMYDCCLRYDKITEEKRMPKLESFVLPFSMASNITRLVSVPQDNSLAVMSGIKAMAMVIMVNGHLGMVKFGNRIVNMALLEQYSRDVSFFWAHNNTVFVDTFFLVSGHLIARLLTDHLRKRGNVNLLLVCLDRIMRVLPSYVTVITFYMYVFPLLGHGPKWNEIIGRESNRCLENWWTNLLYVNNFVRPNQSCLVQSWYLTADFQMFVFTAPVVYFLFKNPQWKKTVLWGLLSGTVILHCFLVYQNGLWSSFPLITDWYYDPPSLPYYVNFYIQSYFRYIPYIVGVCSHFVCERLMEKKFQFTTTHKFIVCFADVLLIVGMLLYGSIRFYLNRYEFVLTEQVLFAAIHRLIWSVTCATTMVVHRTSGFGVLSDILCARIFIFLSRLSLTILLTNFVIILYSESTDEQNSFLNTHKFIILLMGSYLYSIITALVLTLTVEMPMEIFWKRAKKMMMEAPPERRGGEVSVISIISVPEEKLDVEQKSNNNNNNIALFILPD